MLTGIHFLLTYQCAFECDHCFVFGSPFAEGTFALKQVENLLDEARKIATIKTIYYEGGEAFLFYPLLVESVRLASNAGFNVGIVTNGTLRRRKRMRRCGSSRSKKSASPISASATMRFTLAIKTTPPNAQCAPRVNLVCRSIRYASTSQLW